MWLGGLVAVFATIFVVATAFDSGNGKPNERGRARGTPRTTGGPPGGEEPSMGLSPEIANQQDSGN
jgi:hypothetical protein